MINEIKTFAPIKKTTIVTQLMDRIIELISMKAYKPGDKLPTESELASMFGVGRSSIRETIKIFNHLGVLESKSAIGTFVCDRQAISREVLTWALILGHDELAMIIDLRAAMELWCYLQLTNTCRCSPEAGAPTLAALRSILDSISSAAAAGDPLGIVNADYEFHGTIIKASSNTLFVDFYDILRSFLLKEIAACQATYSDWSMSVSEHRELIEAAESGDVLFAEKAYQKHIENVKNLLNVPSRTAAGKEQSK
jgi:GntR family transcriptional regulator, transcriptional repressor for pyruvate dehydrogenase complex